jgi:hypothetical protein
LLAGEFLFPTAAARVGSRKDRCLMMHVSFVVIGAAAGGGFKALLVGRAGAGRRLRTVFAGRTAAARRAVEAAAGAAGRFVRARRAGGVEGRGVFGPARNIERHQMITLITLKQINHRQRIALLRHFTKAYGWDWTWKET